MAKLELFGSQIVFYCPGCDGGHSFHVKPWTKPDGRPGPVWHWDGDFEKPTFLPSLVVNKDLPDLRCHLYLRKGMLEFLSDCYHELAGKTVPLEEMP